MVYFINIYCSNENQIGKKISCHCLNPWFEGDSLEKINLGSRAFLNDTAVQL